MEKRALDWQAVEARAQGMSLVELHAALEDIQRTLPHADALDRQDRGDRGGYYRDESSVYRIELKRRGQA